MPDGVFRKVRGSVVMWNCCFDFAYCYFLLGAEVEEQFVRSSSVPLREAERAVVDGVDRAGEFVCDSQVGA